MGSLLAVSDLHVGHGGNRSVVEAIEPDDAEDWLIVAGDVAEKVADVQWALTLLRSKFGQVIWVPGNHELWTVRTDPVQLRGEERYRHLVEFCRDIGVLTPEDDYPIWTGAGSKRDAKLVVPLFVPYDYTFLPPGATNRAEGMELTRRRGTAVADEHLLDPHPYDDVGAWCTARIAYTEQRLRQTDPRMPKVLINHFPLVREPTRMLLRTEFSMWCGSTRTSDWHRAYNADCVVYGHLHIRRTDYFDGIRFEEVSVGYPREWKRRGLPDPLLRQIYPGPLDGPVTRIRSTAGARMQGAVRTLMSMRRR